jgi:DNA-binding transcriptional MocR family regulator
VVHYRIFQARPVSARAVLRHKPLYYIACPQGPQSLLLHEETTVHIDKLSRDEAVLQLEQAQGDYEALRARGLSLDLTRGKPSTEQVALSNALDGILDGNYQAADGTDTRNYGGLTGIAEARALFGSVLDVPAEEILVGGNSSLSLMYTMIEFALTEGVAGPTSAWGNTDTVKFLCPSPGYDRHYAVCEHLGIEMITVPMHDTGPDMDVVEHLVGQDDTIRGMWCVPRFSNPTGCVYSDETVDRIARLGKIAAKHFIVMWDNAYAVHGLYDDAPVLASIRALCEQHGTQDSVVQFGSTSKVTFPGAGVAFMSSSKANLAALGNHIAYQTIGPDKVNQLRHVKFLRDAQGLAQHMKIHAQIVRPRFECVLQTLEQELGGTGLGRWQSPRGGYFVSFHSQPGLATKIVKLAADIGVKLTPAGATFPYGKDPQDSNIRLSPTFPTLEDVQASVAAFVVCVKLASLQQKLEQS